VGKIVLRYSTILPSTGECVSCDEPIDFTDGDKYVSIGFSPIQKFHITCFMDFVVGLLEFERVFIVEKYQEKERKLN